MKLKNIPMQDDLIELHLIIRKLAKEKILILSVSFVFMVLGYIYGSVQNKEFETKIVLRTSSPGFIKNYEDLIFSNDLNSRLSPIKKEKDKDIDELFSYEFTLNLITPLFFDRFIEQNNEFVEFKSYLNKNRISSQEYLNKKFRQEDKKKKEKGYAQYTEYTLTFGEYLEGEKFLNDYVLFVAKETGENFRKLLKQNITYAISNYKIILETLSELKLDKSAEENLSKSNIVIYPYNTNYYYQSNVLKFEISILQNRSNYIDKFKFDYDPIIIKASKKNIITKPSSTFVLMGLFLGLFFSFIIILFKNILKKNNSYVFINL